jgi:hypothetical protein
MTNPSEVLVLVANEKHASICVISDGATRMLRSIDRVFHTQDAQEDAQTAALTARNNYACELMMALGRDASHHEYDGVVIFCDAQMTDHLRDVRTSLISRLLIAQILGMPGGPCHIAHNSLVNAESIKQGALQ